MPDLTFVRRRPTEFVGATGIAGIVATCLASIFAPVGWILVVGCVALAADAAAVLLVRVAAGGSHAA